MPQAILVAGSHYEAVDRLAAEFDAGRRRAVGIETCETGAEDLVAVFHARVCDRGYSCKQSSSTPLHSGQRPLGFGNRPIGADLHLIVTGGRFQRDGLKRLGFRASRFCVGIQRDRLSGERRGRQTALEN